MTTLRNLIERMTLEEKVALCSGRDFWCSQPIERLGIPSVTLTDGPHGLRKQVGDTDRPRLNESVPATCFPTASALAATWNRDLVYRLGEALGEECRQEDVGVILGPGANIKRSPLCGRNFEYFSEDPFLSGEIAKSHIRGVQSQGIGASLKHYAVNNQEHRRMTIDAIVDERALHEIYLRGFEIAVKGAQPWTVMGAYNRVNGSYCCEHTQLLRETLWGDWGHEGLVVTDWGAMNDKVSAMEAGLALEMPGTDNSSDEILIEAVLSGVLDVHILDQAVEQILEVVFKANRTLSEDFAYDADAHHALAREVASEGAVLLKNESQTLPLRDHCRIALLGAFAQFPRYQGAGSSTINPPRLETLYEELVKIAGEEAILYSPGYPLTGDTVDEELVRQALRRAADAEVAVINVGLPDLFEVEGVDRTHMRLPESHNRLVEAVASAHSKVVVVLSNGSPVEMPWVEDVEAILEGYLGGQAGAGAVVDLLFGIANPCGRLAETFPLRVEDTPAYHHYPGGPRTVEYRESIYVGYRFYDTVGRDVLFPFGHGLSYSLFEYGHLQLSQTKIAAGQPLIVSLTVRNLGDLPGKEVVQLYVSPVDPTAFRPRAELKGFEKISVEPGEERAVSFTLGERAFASYNTASKAWHVESGVYRILVGASSRDIRLMGEVEIESLTDDCPIPPQDRLPAYREFPADGRVTASDFAELIGRPLPPNTYPERGEYTINTPVSDMADSFVARRLMRIMRRQVAKINSRDPESPNARMMEAVVDEAPLRILMVMGDQLNRPVVEGLLKMINGAVVKGVLCLLRNWRRG